MTIEQILDLVATSSAVSIRFESSIDHVRKVDGGVRTSRSCIDGTGHGSEIFVSDANFRRGVRD
jgi:hypothetical protein